LKSMTEAASEALEEATLAAAPFVESKLNDLGSEKLPRTSLARFYRRLWNHCKGDKGKLTLFTIVVLIFSEWPIVLFTALDVLKLKSLYKYRLHYDPELAGHLGVRKYPPNDLIWKTAKVAERNFFFAYVFPGALLIKIQQARHLCLRH